MTIYWQGGLAVAHRLGDSYFNLTNSKTKIAHIPTVTGNCTN